MIGNLYIGEFVPFEKKAKCVSVDCMRALPWAELVCTGCSVLLVSTLSLGHSHAG
jgi:hypothetical protein